MRVWQKGTFEGLESFEKPGPEQPEVLSTCLDKLSTWHCAAVLLSLTRNCESTTRGHCVGEQQSRGVHSPSYHWNHVPQRRKLPAVFVL